tara:strand:+ start:626 stop:1039 length:414 start_codon:yes stop_codon:yes gene_type:complete
MFLEILSNSDLIILNSFFLLIILFFMFKWFFGQVREICKEPEGFVKFGQVAFIVLSWGCFLVILVYYIFVKTQVNALDIILTVVVGFLGTIIGMFFSKEALESLKGKVERRSKKILDTAEVIKDTKELLEELIKTKI